MLIAAIAPLCILVAQDNLLIGDLLAEMLTIMGHDVCAVETTETSTIASAAQHRPDLLIADCSLREGSGIVATETILRWHLMAHIFVTGDHASVRLRMPDAVILENPFNEERLKATIRKVVQIKSATLVRRATKVAHPSA
jgi:CheY-like chemotaxis protein